MSSFYGYPEPKESHEKSYRPKPGTNPVVKGLPLAIAGSVVANLGFVSSFLWSNAGFKSLREVKALEEYGPRYDPTVVSVDSSGKPESRVLGIKDVTFSKEIQNERSDVLRNHEAFKAGKTTPSAVARAILEVIEANPEHQKAFLSIKKLEVLAEAEESTNRYRQGRPLSVLDGSPVGIKDEVDLEGHPKSLGTSQSEPCPVNGTSWCVRKWQEAGAIIIGKLNMHELGLDTTNNNPITGTPLNPHNVHYYTGGSSGGSAYAVSAGLLPVTLGADGGGSIRLPATYCGIYGLKPSHGRISVTPTVGLADSCGVVGPLASCMADLEIAYRMMAIPDPSDPTSAQFKPPTMDSNPTGKKTIAIFRPWFDHADPAVINSCDAALKQYEKVGYEIIDISLPYLAEGQLAHAMTILSEITTGVHELGHLTPANKILLAVGKHTPATDFLLSQKMRSLLMQHLSFLFTKHPGLLIVSPTSPNSGWHIAGGAAELKHGVSDANTSVRSMTYVWLANFTGCPALSIPVGMVDPKEGQGKIPIGLMAMAEWGAEENLFQWGRVGENWAWAAGNERVNKPRNWVDILKTASSE